MVTIRMICLACVTAFLLRTTTLVLADEVPRVAIIGGGMGGTYAAYLLGQSPVPLQIDLYERWEALGGRVAEVEVNDQVSELGASIIYHKNYYVVNATRAMNLTLLDITDTGGGEAHIYNGKEIVFTMTPTWKGRLLAALRYGLPAWRWGGLTTGVFDHLFSRVYQFQSEGRSYEHPESMLMDMGLLKATQSTVEDLMKVHLTGLWSFGRQQFMNEVAGAVNRINYNQKNGQLNGLAGLVSFLPAADSNLCKVAEGNSQLPKKLAEASGAQVHHGTEVLQVQEDRQGGYSLVLRKVSSKEEERTAPYHVVIIATPLELSNITLTAANLPDLPVRQYQQTVTLYLEGRLRPGFFHAQQLGDEADVWVTDDSNTPFTVLADKGPGRKSGTRIYKAFFNEPPSSDLLGDMFFEVDVLATRSWWAYPLFSVPERFAPFLLAPGLIYNNALENAASALEMAAIAARNSALLALKHLDKQCSAKQ